MVLKRFLLAFLFALLHGLAFSNPVVYSFNEKINWNGLQRFTDNEGKIEYRLFFEDAVYFNQNPLPYFIKNYPIHSENVSLKLKIIPVKTAKLSNKELSVITSNNLLTDKDSVFQSFVTKTIMRKQPYASVSVLPVRWNIENGYYEKLIEFKVEISVSEDEVKDYNYKKEKYSDNSVLASGEWIKIKIDKDGVYKLTYSDLQAMGFDVNANPKRFAVFGNGGGVLPEKNDMERYDDLVENSITVKGEEDGVFNEGDYILFYGKGPVVWRYNQSIGNYVHINNIYDDYAYYFLTVLDHDAKRIKTTEQPAGNADVTVDDFIDRQYHESDEMNLAGTGRLWVGEYFDFDNNKTFDFTFPNIKGDKNIFFKGSFVAVSPTSSRFKIYANNNFITSVSIPANPADGYNFGKIKGTAKNFKSNNDNVTLKVEYIKYSNSAVGYLDFLELSAYRKLIMAGNQMLIRNEFETGNIAKYLLTSDNNLTIWDVTNPVDVKKVDPTYSDGKYIFKTNIESVKKFMAFNAKEYYTPEFVEKVENQNLHAIKNIDYLIIAHPKFIEQAKKLAKYHETHDNFKSEVVPVYKIYNEFSSGAQDITAIRDFVKMVYDKSDEGKELKYLLLFGDASYDYKNRIPDNTNLVPCWESEESLYIINSIASDDYFGYLDDGEGVGGKNSQYDSDRVDIGIGRLPVDTPEQAENAVDKIIEYSSEDEKNFGSWRNILTFVADDGDYNIYLNDTEKLTGFIETNFPAFNIDKIYVDGFKQISTPTGQQAPEVNNAINNRIEKGTLIFNYVGHGGELGLGHEQFVKLGDINSWSNFDKLTVFITATCEFSRYDDPKRVSAGEQVFLNPKGGGIALFSTSRATYAAANYTLNKAIFTNNIFDKKDGEYPAFGDVIMNSKVLGNINDKKFVLLGDPALKLAYTDYTAKTLQINQNIRFENDYDTIKAFQHAIVTGEIVDENGNVINDFNGKIYPTVYDKRKEVITFGDESSPMSYSYWSSIIFNGKASIENGKFQFEFVVPKDIAYNYGVGRISYYFNNDKNDGNGYSEDIVIGGYDENADIDNNGPNISLYINDTLFTSCDITDENPTLYAIIEDESGINTTGNGIGHDIVAIIDDDVNQTYILNDYYESFLNRYDKGSIKFPFRNLEKGMHTLSLKVWDIYNNSSTAYIDFNVTDSEKTIVEDLMNFPNPFSDKTTFSFKHNQNGKNVEITIDIYSLTGKKIRTMKIDNVPLGYVNRSIVWDGTTKGGRKLPSGIYPYKLTVKNEAGKISGKTAKLIILR